MAASSPRRTRSSSWCEILGRSTMGECGLRDDAGRDLRFHWVLRVGTSDGIVNQRQVSSRRCLKRFKSVYTAPSSTFPRTHLTQVRLESRRRVVQVMRQRDHAAGTKDRIALVRCAFPDTACRFGNQASEEDDHVFSVGCQFAHLGFACRLRDQRSMASNDKAGSTYWTLQSTFCPVGPTYPVSSGSQVCPLLVPCYEPSHPQPSGPRASDYTFAHAQVSADPPHYPLLKTLHTLVRVAAKSVLQRSWNRCSASRHDEKRRFRGAENG